MALNDFVTVRKMKGFWQEVKAYIRENAVSKFKTPFTTNVAVGAVDAGTEIAAGTDVVSIVKNMLVKLKYATVFNTPSVTLRNNGTAFGEYEVGTNALPSFNSTYTDGRFTTYTSPSETTTIIAGCAKGTTTYYRGNTALEGNTDDYILPLGTTTYRVEQAYDESTTTPKNSDGNNSSVSIDSGVCEASGVYRAYLRLFTGVFAGTSALPTSNYRQHLSSGALVKAAPSMSVNFSNKVIAVAVPDTYTLVSAIEPQTGEDETPYLIKNGESIQIADVNGSMHDYKLYVFAYDAALGKSVNLVFS